MDRRRAAGALLALAACIACSTAAPTASNQTALELFEGPSEGCYYNFQHYGEGDRIMTNEPCLNCTCHNRMLMCYLKVCPFTKPIGQDCTIEKRADQCCPIVTCPDVPVDLLTSTSTTSPAEYGATGLGKVDKYGCSINGKYFPEGSKVPPTPNKPCEHCYCIRNMTTCVMQECTLHVDGCTPIYHKEVCCPVRYSCDHLEDEMLLLDDMTTTVRPTPGFLLTTTTMPSVTQISQNCVHDDQIIADGALIKTEIACEHCYCMKGDIVCVVQECGTPMENEGKNCTSLPPRQGQCCPDTYICEGDELLTEPTTGVTYEELTTFAPPRRVEGSGYRNEPDEPYTEIPAFEGSGEEHATTLDSSEIFTSQKQTPQIIDETFAPTEESLKPSLTTTEPDKEQNTVPDDSNESASDSELLGKTTLAQEATTTSQPGVAESMKDTTESKTTSSDYLLTSEADTFISKDDEFIMTTESISQYTKDESSKITEMKPETETTETFNIMEALATQPSYLQPSSSEASTVYKQDDKTTTSDVSQLDEVSQPQVTITEVPKDDSDKDDQDKHDISHDKEDEVSLMTTTESRIEPTSETTSVNPVENEIDEDVLPPGRIPGEGDCLLNGITYKNSTNVPNINNCHSSCKCVSSIIKCDPIICSPPPKHMDNMNDCQPIYDTPDACCPTYICHSRETIPPESHSQMSGTESPKPSDESECHGEECQPHKTKPSEQCNSDDCGPVTEDQEKECKNGVCQNIETSSSTGSPLPKHPEACIGDNCMPVVETCTDGKCESSTSSQTICESENGCQPTESCEGNNCAVGSENTITKDELPICKDSEECKKIDTSSCEGSTCDTSSVDTTVPDINRIQSECKEENCRRKDQSEDNKPPECSGSTCIITQETEGESGGMTTESVIKDQVYKESTTEMINDAYSKLPESERTPSEDTQKVTQDEAITENQDISLVHSTEKSEESETEGISQTVTEKGESYTISSDTHATKMEEAITEIYNKPETDSKEQVTESIKDTMKEILTDSPLATQYDKQPSDLPKEDINYEATKPFEGSTETSDIEPHDQIDKDEISGTSIVKDFTQTQEMSTKPTNILETTSKPLETDEPEQEFTNKQETFTESSKQEKTTIESQEIGNTESQQNVFITESSATLLPEITTEEYVSIPIEGEEVTKEHNKDTDMLAETTTEQSVKIKESSKPHDSKLDETPNVVTEVISTDATIHELHKDEKTTESTIEDQADLSKPTEIYEAITDKQEYNTMPDEVQEHQLVLVTTDSPLIHATQPSPMEENLITQMHDDIHKESPTTTIPEEFDIKEITTQPSEISITNIEEVTSESTDKHEISSQTVPDKLEEHTDTAIKDIHEVSTLMPEETVEDDTNLKPLDKEPQENDMTTDAILINEAGLGTTISSILPDKEITPKYADTESGMEPSEQSTANPKIHSTISDESIALHDETEKKTLQTSTSSQVGSEAVTTEYSKQPFEDKNEMPDFTQIGGQTQEPSIDERTLAPTISYTEGYDDSHDTTISVSIDIDKTKEDPQYTTPETVSQFIEKEDVTDDHPEENVTKDIKDEMKGTKEPQEPTESTVLKDMEVQNIVTHASEATTEPQETETKLAVEFQTDQAISSTPTNVIKEDKEQTESPMSLITEPAESIHSEDADHSIIDTTTLIPKETKVSTVEEEKTPDHYYTKPQVSYTESPQVTEEHGETENTFESKTPSQTFPEKETKPEISFTTSSQEYTTVKILDIGDKEKTPSPPSSEVSEKISPTTEYQDSMLTQSPVTKDSEVYPTEVLHESTSVVPVVVSSEESLAPEQEETSTRYPEVYGSITTLSYDHETDTKPDKIPVKDTLDYATDQPQNNVDFTTVDSIISETMKDDHGDTQQTDKLDDVKDSEHSIPTEQTTKYPEIIDKIPDKQTGEPSKQEEYTETTEQHITTEAAISPEKTVSSDVEIQSSVDLDHEKSTEVQQSSDDKDVTTPIYQDLTTTKEESMPGLPESHLITSDTSTTESSEISSSDENNRRTLLPGLETVQPEQYTTEKQKITELPEITKPQDMEQTGGTSQETSSSSPEMEIDTLVSVIQESDHVTSIPAATERIPTITETVPSYQDQTISVITESIEELTTKEHITSKPETELDVIKDIQTEQPLPIETEKDLPVIPIDKPAEIPSEHTLAQEPRTETSIPKENEISEPVATEASVPADTESDISVPIETISDSKATEPSMLKETEYVAIDSSMPHETESAVFEVTETSVPKETEAAVSIVTETSVPEETEASLPEKTDTSLNKIPEVPVSEITETSVSESSEPKTPEVTEASQSEVTEASQPEVTEASQPEVTEASQPEVTEASQPEVTEASQPEVTEASQPEVSEASQPEITEASQPEVTEAPRPKVTELSQPEVTKVSQPEVTEASQPEVSEASQPEVTETSQPEVTEASQPEVTEASQPKVSEPSVTEIIEVSVTEYSKPKAPEVTEVSQPDITEGSVPEKTKDTESELTSVSATEVTEPSVTEETDISIQKETESGSIYSQGTTYKPKDEKLEAPVEESPTLEPIYSSSETTPYFVELQEHTTKVDEDISSGTLDGKDITKAPEIYHTERGDQPLDNIPDTFTQEDSHEEHTTKETVSKKDEQLSTLPPEQASKVEIPTEEVLISSDVPLSTMLNEPVTTQTVSSGEQGMTMSPTVLLPLDEHDKYTTAGFEIETTSDKKDMPLGTEKTPEHEVTDSDDALVPVITKTTTIRTPEEITTHLPVADNTFTKPEGKPSESYSPTTASDLSKPVMNEIQSTEELPSPDFPPSGSSGYGQEPDYVEEDQAFGPGTCRYGGKVYVSAQQIPRDDPCDFCFCFRSDIICLQQSCPPPIHGCHEEPIQGFCCPRYECPVSMATTLNVTTTTTTTTTTLPPHFLPHAYKGAAQRRGCQIKGHSYKVGEVVRASSGPCLHCTCGGDGQMKCDPKACTPEPMLRQMIAAAVSSKRRR